MDSSHALGRRAFLGAISYPTLGAIGWTTLAPRAHAVMSDLAGHTGEPAAVAQDETFWFEVQQAFTVDRTLINLNNGGVSPAPATIQAAHKRHLDYSNTAPTYAMWKVLEPQREGVRQRLARNFDCDAEELALTRNSSEKPADLPTGHRSRARR